MKISFGLCGQIALFFVLSSSNEIDFEAGVPDLRNVPNATNATMLTTVSGTISYDDNDDNNGGTISYDNNDDNNGDPKTALVHKKLASLASHCNHEATHRDNVAFFTKDFNHIVPGTLYTTAVTSLPTKASLSRPVEMAGLTGPGLLSGSAMGEVAEAACAGVPACMAVGAGVVAVASVGFLGYVLSGVGTGVHDAPTPDPVQEMDFQLSDVEVVKEVVKKDLENLPTYADFFKSIRLGNAARRMAAANTINHMIDEVQKHVQVVLDDLLNVAKIGQELVKAHRAKVKAWNSCWISCGEKPESAVPKNVEDLTNTMADHFNDFEEYIDATTNCCKQITHPVEAGQCSAADLQHHVLTLQTKFRPISLEWTQYKHSMCEHHQWTVCTPTSVLAEHRKLYNEHILQGVPQHLQFRELVPAGVCAIMAAVMVVHRVLLRAKVKKSRDAGGSEPLLSA